ncbi:SpoIIE family protein phosphatase [Kitasatospora sp. NPDC096128]|uniref:SpoIIE family protein phosphatase n=1 Tax=Kitasatospora sp. NPDC096128 TaxID=3155547 RepID=UPI003333E7B0
MTDDSRSPEVLALAETVRRLQDAAARAGTEARRRSVVDVATGILAERLGVPPTEAVVHLARLADEAAVPVESLAADICGSADASGEDPGPAHGAAGPVLPSPSPSLSALATATDLDRAAEAVLEQAGRPLGAHAVALWQRMPSGALALAAHAGLSAVESEAWSRVPPGARTPAQRAISDGEDLWPGDPRTGGPSVGPESARAVLVLRDRGRRRGALEVLWRTPVPTLGASPRRVLCAVADLCAALLPPGGPEAPSGDRAALLEGLVTPALLLAPVLRDARVVDFTLLAVNDRFRDPMGRPREELEGASLLETYPEASATGLFERLLTVHETGAPLRAERVRLVFHHRGLSVPAGVLLGVVPLADTLLVEWEQEPGRTEAAEQDALLRQAQRLARVAGFEECVDDGRIRWSEGLRELYGLPPDADPVPLDRIAERTHPDDLPTVRRMLDQVRRLRRPAAAVFRLAQPDGTHRYTRLLLEPVVDDEGRLNAVRGAYHDVSLQHWTEVALGATRERLADSEQESAERARLALRLQQAILPAAPLPFGATGLRAAVRYRPAAKRDRVGGDWYDVLPLPDKRVLLAVGDVAGHGIGAATGMVALRHALRGLAVTGAGPGRLLEWTNTVALREPGQVSATAVCVLLDPAGGELRWARAGHLPPILVRPEGAEVLPLPRGVLLGALEEARYEEQTARLALGDVLLLYTDGLAERRDRPVEESVDQLVRAAGPPGPDLERYLDRLLDLSSSDTDDDTCLIAVQME